ncbi:NADH dehydrogenase, FAD-containing subunit [Streptomyces sp. LaPpAH-199]|uniref:NAD(P)/FAD-dependent oxidoreductase n=1 Tax=Streptomyces TaxID=1883 RepID=UPI00088F9CA8|nr:FAD-dependent oxidoreductase [Streptomyces sp. LaPpAH-199]MYW80958.1 FAD-dependent oxidoreductase [Streptomyces sp. SID8369]SDD02675.1 NADH dehydrogenase, FAD-containing subunit [Streptomyces sp. LaPpAH-199]
MQQNARHTAHQHRIVVVGAGYTGASAAGRLAARLHREDVSITLVNAEPDFVERVRLHQLAVGQNLLPRPLDAMFAGTGVRLRLARVTGIDVDARTVTVTPPEAPAGSGAEDIPYDTLVYALGSAWNTHGVPGVEEHAHDIAGRAGALRLRDRLADLAPGSPVAVVGGGLTGVEAATELAEARPDLAVSLISRGPLGDWLSPKGARHLRKVFAGLRITVHENTDVTAVHADRATTTGGDVPAEATLWTTGFAVHPIARATTLETAEDGQITVDATMRSTSHPDVYAIGDAARAAGPGGRPLRMSCASGVPSAWQAADAIAARLTGTKLPTISARYFNQCVSLGRKEGLIQYVTADDRAVSAALTGRPAALYKELVCKAAAWGVAHPTLSLPTRRRRLTTERARAGAGAPTA